MFSTYPTCKSIDDTRSCSPRIVDPIRVSTVAHCDKPTLGIMAVFELQNNNVPLREATGLFGSQIGAIKSHIGACLFHQLDDTLYGIWLRLIVLCMRYLIAVCVAALLMNLIRPVPAQPLTLGDPNRGGHMSHVPHDVVYTSRTCTLYCISSCCLQLLNTNKPPSEHFIPSAWHYLWHYYCRLQLEKYRPSSAVKSA